MKLLQILVFVLYFKLCRTFFAYILYVNPFVFKVI